MEHYVEFISMFEQISYPHINCEILNQLKENYKHIINSKRALEKIIDLRSLLKVLEKRAVLQFDDISILKYIARLYVKNKFIEKLISEYEKWLEENSSKINNIYICAVVQKSDPMSEISINQLQLKMQNLTNETQYYATNTPIYHVNHEKELQELIINKVSKNIGKYWADVCRKLNLEESIIDELEMKYFNETKNFEKMFKQALNLYFSEPHLKWKTDLMQALESSRRKDLKEMVEEIIFPQHS